MRRYNVILLGLFLTLPAVLPASEAHTRAYGPQSIVRVTRPTVRWEVWPGEGSTLTSSMMSINGTAVRPTYDVRGRALTYTPQDPLQPGDYRVDCKVVVDDFMPVTKSWKFKVASDASVSVPEPTSEQKDEIAEVNRFRHSLGLPDLLLDGRLCAAAMSHSNYLNLNKMTGHYQQPGDPGFVGATPADRLDAFGYSDGSWEGVDFGPQGNSAAIERLFDAPYHRIPFMQPGAAFVGAGSSARHMTIEFGMSPVAGTVVSPADGQRNIDCSWKDYEMPDPLSGKHANDVVGYPIVFASFTASNEKIVIEKASLETAFGDKVPFYLKTPANDAELLFAAILIPKQPLQAMTGYTVRVDAHTQSGRDVSQSWRFVTGNQ